MSASEFDSLSDAVERRVLEILDLDEADQGPALEALYREHPGHAYAVRAWLRSMDRDADGSVVRSDAGSSSSWRKLVEQLRSRGPAWTRYVFEGEIARGGMGVVHRVRDQDAHRSLALKVILGQGEAAPTGDTPPVDDRSLGRFLEEAQVASQLDHPGIVPVHEIGVDGEGRVYFTMKLVQGQDLRAVFDMARTGRDGWSETRGLNVLLRVCEAMAYAHAKGVIHRDLKPANVMVGKFGEVYVMDWGLARVLDREDDEQIATREPSSTVDRVKSDRKARAEDTPDTPLVTMDGDVVGTPSYMPPEQAEGRLRDIGPASDVYAVGAMLYHLLAGQMPYVTPGEPVSPHSLLTTVVERPPEPLSELQRDVTPELLAIVEKAMARDLAARYPDMTALAQDLRAYLENRVVAAYETGAWAELKKWVKRNKAIATATATAAAAVAVLAASWALFERESAERQAAAVYRLSDALRLAELKSEMNALWPAHPSQIDRMDRWLVRAYRIVDRLQSHETTLKEIRSRGTAQALPTHLIEITAREDKLAKLRAHLARHAGDRPNDDIEDPEERAQHVADEEEEIAELERQLSVLRTTELERREREREYAFADDVEHQWWHDTMFALVVDLHAFLADDPYAETIANIRERRKHAASIEHDSVTGSDAAAQWNRARDAIRTHPAYDGLDLAPQLGLFPLEPNPVSRLWEFWHVQSGDRPERDPATGSWRMTQETGIVLVLIPGGRTMLGSQSASADQANFDSFANADEQPLHALELDPYFLSKYEMSQGQWKRFVGRNISFYGPGTIFAKQLTSRAHPVERVSWKDGRDVLYRLGLVLPTEAQWEHACRAGTDTTWWTGSDRTALGTAENLADRTSGAYGPKGWEFDADIEDGYGIHAPVGSFRANPFGLHDMAGNVREWCSDRKGAYGGVTEPGTGLRDDGVSAFRIVRGGSFNHRADRARSAYRHSNPQTLHYEHTGVRPARRIDR